MYAITKFNMDPRTEADKQIGQSVTYPRFEDFAKDLMECEKGGKYGSYFVRGKLDHNKRLNENLHSTNLLIIDADKGKDGGLLQDYQSLSAILSTGDIEHFIYQTHSHSEAFTRFRCIIPLDVGVTEEQYTDLAPRITTMLNALEYNLDWATEARTWSQPWFYPRRDDPEDGLWNPIYVPGNTLLLESLRVWDLPGAKKSDGTPSTSSSSMSWQQHFEEIQKGNFHEHLKPFIMGLALDGVDEASIIAQAQNVMASIPDSLKDDRWQDRYNDIPRSTEGAIKRAKELGPVDEAVEDYGITFDNKESVGDLPWPPGMLGELCDLYMKQATYPYKESALVASLGLLSGIVGRKFNVNSGRGLGLNVYMMLTARTAAGKDSIGNFISDSLRMCHSETSSFQTFSNFHTPKSLVNDHLLHGRSCSMVIGEMGYMLGSNAGDGDNKRRFFLEAFGKSGHRDILKGVGYADSKNSIPDLASPCLSVIGESTPRKLLESLEDSNSLEDGWLPRFFVLHIESKRPRINKKYAVMPSHIMNRITQLCEMCEKDQAANQFECHLLDLWDESEYDAMEIYWSDIMEEFAESDIKKSIMASRAFAKTLKLSGLATVINKEKDSPKCLVIEQREWEWAKRFVQYEFDNINMFFQGSFGNSSLDNAATRIMGDMLMKALDKRLQRDTKCPIKLYNAMNPFLRSKRAVPVSNLRQAIGYKFDDFGNIRSGRDGMDQIIFYGSQQNYWVRDKSFYNEFTQRNIDVLILNQNFYDRKEAQR